MGIPFAAPSKTHRIVHAGKKVTYHDAGDDRRLTVVQFDRLGRADLMDDDQTILPGVQEGKAIGQWSR